MDGILCGSGEKYSNNKSFVWGNISVQDYGAVVPFLPVRTERVTQLSRGNSYPDVAMVGADGAMVVRVRTHVDSVGETILDPASTAIFVMAPVGAECRVNGMSAGRASLYLPFGGDGFHIRGGRREVIAVALKRDAWTRTLEALHGVDQGDSDDLGLRLEAGQEAVDRLRRSINTVLDICCHDSGGPDGLHVPDLVARIVTQMADTYMFGLARRAPDTRRAIRAHVVVRKAEEHFEAMEGQVVSLADLCLASGVGKSALYAAFHELYGVAPLAYFHKRRINAARSALLRAKPKRGTVTRIASECGLTELGRFSKEYYALFGEMPSVTLRAKLAT